MSGVRRLSVAAVLLRALPVFFSARLLAPQLDRECHTKDIDFSPSGIKQRWDAGHAHTKAALDRSPWVGEFEPLSGVILHEQVEMMAVE